MLSVSSEEITEGNLLRSLVVLSLPLVAQNFVLIAQQVIDIVFLGRFSADAVAAVGLATPVVGLLYVVTYAPYVGTQVAVSRRIGADDETGARRGLFNGLLLTAVACVVGGSVFFVAVRPLLEVMTAVRPTARGEFVDLGAQYVSMLALGLPAIGLANTVEDGGFVAWGDSPAALFMNLVALVGNVVLDAILIFGLGPAPRLGVRGAALATVLGSLAGLLFGLALIVRGRNGGMLSRAASSIEAADVREIVDLGWPISAQNGVRQLIRLPVFLLVFVAGGGAALAAYIVGARVATIAFVPPQGLQQAAQSVIGQNLGAGNQHRAVRTTYLAVGVAASVLTVVGAAQLLVPEALATAFAPTLSPEGFAFAVEYLAILAYGYPALGAIYTFEAGFNAAGRSRVSFVSTLLQYGGVRLPIAAVGVLSLSVGVTAVFWAVTVSNVAAALWLGGYYRYAVDDGMMARAKERATEPDEMSA